MKKRFRFLAIILAVLCLPINVLASDISMPEETTPVYESTATETDTSSNTTETAVETETIILGYVEEETVANNSRMIGGGGEVDFGPPEEDTGAIRITSAEIPDGVYSLQNPKNPTVPIGVCAREIIFRL